VIHYRIDGKRVEEALGWLSQGWTQEKCGDTRNKLKESAKKGGHQTLKEQRVINEAAKLKQGTVSDLLEEFWREKLSKTPSGKERRRMVEKDVIPSWGKRKLETITRRDTVLLIDKVRERAPVLANRLQIILVSMFNFACERGLLEQSQLQGMLKQKEAPKERVLTDDEIRLFWQATDPDNLDLMDAHWSTKLALRMILITGQRPGEVVGITWQEIEGDIWKIPSGRMKGRVAHDVPLTGLALEAIEKAKLLTSDSDFVFRSYRVTVKAATTRLALSKALLRHWKEIGIEEPFTPHDLRRTLRTRLGQLGIVDALAELVIGHKQKGLVAVYNQYDYDKEKRQALGKWDRKLRQIVGLEVPDTGKVIQLKFARG
jgi:integrase